MPKPELLYGTKAVSRATGASLRQLQWQAERGVILTTVIDHKRLYRFRDALYVRLIVVLDSKHLTLRRAARALSQLKGDLDLMRCVDARAILFVGYSSSKIRLVSRAGVLDVLLEAKEPFVAVNPFLESRQLVKALKGKEVLQ